MAASLGFEPTTAYLNTRHLHEADTHLDAHKIRQSAQLIEIIKAWSRLPEALKAGVLAIVRSEREPGK